LLEKKFKDVSIDNPEYLLSFPDHIRKTIYALIVLGGKANSDEVADITKRTRAAESGYMNQLVARGELVKRREGRKVYFMLLKR
jgi:hypothetical protein